MIEDAHGKVNCILTFLATKINYRNRMMRLVKSFQFISSDIHRHRANFQDDDHLLRVGH